MTAWTEVAITQREFQAARCSFGQRVQDHDIFMVLFERRGIRMTGPATLIIAQPFELINDTRGQRVVVRQGPVI